MRDVETIGRIRRLTSELAMRSVLKRPGGERLSADERVVLSFLERRGRHAPGRRNGLASWAASPRRLPA